MSHTHTHDHTNMIHLRTVFGLTLVFMFLEYVTGWFTGSVALQSDALHMFSDAVSLLVAIAGIRWHKQLWATRINAIFMIILIASIYVQAWFHWMQPSVIQTMPMVIVAILGLGVNIVAYRILGHGHGHHMESAKLHILGDLLSSVGVIVSAVAMYITSWWWLDVVTSVLLATFLMPPTYRLLCEKGP